MILELSDNRDRLRSIRAPLPLRRLAFLGRFRQTQSEPPWKPDLPQEILIVVTMEYEPWHLVSVLRFHSASEDEDAVSRALHKEHVGVPVDAGHVIDARGRVRSPIMNSNGTLATRWLYWAFAEEPPASSREAGDGGDDAGARIHMDSFQASEPDLRTPRHRTTGSSDQTARMWQECWASMKGQAGIDPGDPPRSEQRVLLDLARLENGMGDLDRRVFAITRVFEHVRNRHPTEVGSRRSRFESTWMTRSVRCAIASVQQMPREWQIRKERLGLWMQARSLREICNLFRQYMREGDVDAAVTLHDPDAVVLNREGQLRRGPAATRRELTPVAASRAVFDFSIKQVIESGDIALMHTYWTISSTQQMSVYAIEVARRQADGSWRWLIGDPFTVGKNTAQPLAT